MADENKQWAVVFQSPDDAWLERIGSTRPEKVQQEWRPIIVGTWDECQRFTDTFYNNFQRRGCSLGFYYIVRASVAATLVGKPHNEVTFGGYLGDEEPALDEPPDNLHIAAVHSGDHYENFEVVDYNPEFGWNTCAPEDSGSFGACWTEAMDWQANDPGEREYFVVAHSCMYEIVDFAAGEEPEGNHIVDGKFEHWVWEDGQVVVKTRSLH